MSVPPLVGISACLAGESLRYNGSDKLNRFILYHLKGRVRLLPVCAEVECGMSVPREPMDLFHTPEGIRLITVDSHRDLTELISSWALRKTVELAENGLSGFIFKSCSPSCGLGSARLHRKDELMNTGTGLFAEILKANLPGIPAVEETELTTGNEINRFLDEIKQYEGGILC